MRAILPPALVPPLLLLGGCITSPADGSGKIQTTNEATSQNFQGAVSSPLHDANVLRTKIPEVLLEAMADPYGRPAKVSCPVLIELIQPLDGALGADLDEPSTDEDDVVDKGERQAMGGLATLTSGVIPFRGWVRKLTGAERHDRLVQAAIIAGAVRRAYLKGLGETRGCPPPATPSHVLAGSPVQKQESGLKPLYPIR